MYNKAFDIHHPGIDEFYNSIGRMIQIKSPYFLKVLEPGNFQGHCYFVMEYMPEGDLNDIIARSAPFKEEDALSIIYTIADALKDTYNEHKIVHGELTPDNILIDSEYRLLLRGYGMSRWLHKYIHDKFVQGMIPWYTSPEQIEGKIPDWYSDLYSLGVIFFQLLTGYLPFQNESKEIVCNMHLNKRFPDPRNLNPNIAISDQTVMALKRMGAKSPRRRFSCWEEFIETLDMIAALTFDSEDNAEAITSEPVNPPRRQNVDNSLRSTFNSFFSSDEDEKAEDAGREES
jgi:serine/threonine-protein kinase